jgi:hypothetical protein
MPATTMITGPGGWPNRTASVSPDNVARIAIPAAIPSMTPSYRTPSATVIAKPRR